MNTKIVTTFSTTALLLFVLTVATLAAIVFLATPTPVLANHTEAHCAESFPDQDTINDEFKACVAQLPEPENNTAPVTSGLTIPDSASTDGSCKGVDIAIEVGCDESTDNPITAYMNAVINFLTAGVGLVVTTMIVVGGIQYMTAQGNPQKTQAAILRITNAFIGLVFYIFMFAILQWLIPGGLFG